MRDLFHTGGTHHAEMLHLSASLAGKGKTEEEIAKALGSLSIVFPTQRPIPKRKSKKWPVALSQNSMIPARATQGRNRTNPKKHRTATG
ncbi:hypothetical protein [Thermoplasma volcanium]|uniref:hypothetical protein n=1 Tax=Thermoplasma volcanium TaxID=50339 RepID=UPI001F51B0CE|nr:hypothetical protein [Thermoplasma volcanium]